MHLIKNNPYRKVGLLVGATAREKERQIRRLKQFIEAEQDPQDDYSFPVLGGLKRSLEDVVEAASRLNLDNDKIQAALFWFYKGNEITDEPAFEFLKSGNVKEAAQVWGKLSQKKEITKKNASAFFNWASLYLNAAFSGKTIREPYLEKGIYLKLSYLESDFIKELQELATDSTYQITKKELQLLFLNQIKTEIEKSGALEPIKLVEILNKQEFCAKQDFLKEFVQIPIKQIEQHITETKAKRKANPRDAEIYGDELYENCEELLEQLSDILGTEDIKYQNIADKLALEILQCGIDFFKEFKEEDYDPSEESMKLFDTAYSIAIGSIADQRCQENIDNLQDWIDDKPTREKHKQIKEDLEFITDKLEKFQDLQDSIKNADRLLVACKPKLLKVKSVLGANDELYLGLSSAVAQNAQGMLISAVNETVDKATKAMALRFGLSIINLEDTIKEALDVTYKLGGFDMFSDLKTSYRKNLDGIKSLATQLRISTVHPKVRTQQEISQAESRLREIQSRVFYRDELTAANAKMSDIKGWHFLRTEAEREQQIRDQQRNIDQIRTKSEQEKSSQVRSQQNKISELKKKLQQIDY